MATSNGSVPEPEVDEKLHADDELQGDEADESSEDEDDEDDLVLEGVVVRNPDVSDEEDDEDDEDDEDEVEDGGDEEEEDGDDTALVPDEPAKQKSVDSLGKRKAVLVDKARKKKRRTKDDSLEVSFTFCDMDEKYFHGLKSLLHSSNPVYQEHSSVLADLMIENIAVGTVVGTSLEDSNEADVFGFASVLNVATYQQSPAIQFLKAFCLDHCPSENKKDLTFALSGESKRPAGFLLHGRMINMPLEIVHVLHQQLVLDMDWAVDNADVDSEDERKALDFGAFIRLAPCQKEGHSVVYKYFDDEIFAQSAEFVFTLDAPKSVVASLEKQLVDVMVLTKTGHRSAMADLSKLIHGS